MKIAVNVETTVAAPAEVIFDLVNDPERIPELFTKYGPIAGVRKVENVGDGRFQSGDKRTVTTEDDQMLEEIALVVERPVINAYRLQGIGMPFSLLVRYGEAMWEFTETPAGTRVEWEYSFELTSVLLWPLAALVLRLLFRRWMGQTLMQVRWAAERIRRPTVADVAHVA